MSTYNKIKNKVKGTVKKVGTKIKKAGTKIGKKVLPIVSMGMYKGGGGGGGGDEPVTDEGQRGEAARRLMETQKQAGGGQIKYNTEETL